MAQPPDNCTGSIYAGDSSGNGKAYLPMDDTAISGQFINAEEYARVVRQRDELVKALEKIITINRQRAVVEYGDSNKAETWACVTVARAALAADKE